MASSKRQYEYLHNIDDIYGVSAITVGDWKLIQGESKTDKRRFDFLISFELRLYDISKDWILNGAFIVDSGSTYNGDWDGWYGPSGREWVYDIGGVITSTAGRAAATVGLALNPDAVRNLRENALINCAPKNESLPTCKPIQSPCLFNIREDPCEDNNLIHEFPSIAKKLQEEINKYNETALVPGNLPWDTKADSKLWDHTWNNFGDYVSETVDYKITDH